MERWLNVTVAVLAILIVAMVAVLGIYLWSNMPVDDADNNYQRIVVTDLQKGETEGGVVTAKIQAEPFLYCPETESREFFFRAEFFNGSESLGRGEPDADRYDPFGIPDVGIPRGGTSVTIPADTASIPPRKVDRIRVIVVNRNDQGAPPCREIAFPEELPPHEYWWNSTDSANASNTTGSPESNATS